MRGLRAPSRVRQTTLEPGLVAASRAPRRGPNGLIVELRFEREHAPAGDRVSPSCVGAVADRLDSQDDLRVRTLSEGEQGAIQELAALQGIAVDGPRQQAQFLGVLAGEAAMKPPGQVPHL